MSRIIDWHNHWISPRVVEGLSRRTKTPRITTNERGQKVLVGSTAPGALPPHVLALGITSIEERLRHLDEVGIERQVISWPTTLGTDAALTAEEAIPLWKAYNEDLAEVVAAHPERLTGLAILPTSDIEWAARELERAHEELGLIGATLPVGSFHTLEGAEHFRPILEVAQRHRSHIYLHTGAASAGIPGQLNVSPTDSGFARFGVNAGWSFASSIVTLTLTDFLEPYPDVTFQFAMLGGAITFHTEFIELRAKTADLPINPRNAFRRVYIDTGVFGRGQRALELAVEAWGADRILFGSDYPIVPIDPTLEAVNHARISARDREKILSANGLELLASKPANQLAAV
jgi:predicted TIM-barrel fold metal-dependent hydrolase